MGKTYPAIEGKRSKSSTPVDDGRKPKKLKKAKSVVEKEVGDEEDKTLHLKSKEVEENWGKEMAAKEQGRMWQMESHIHDLEREIQEQGAQIVELESWPGPSRT